MHVVDTHVTNCGLREESVKWGASFALWLPQPPSLTQWFLRVALFDG